MNYRTITIHFINGKKKEMAIDAVNGIRYDGPVQHQPVVIRFGRTDSTRWRELLAAPLTSILYWE